MKGSLSKPSSKKYTKLVPIYQSKEYSKIKSLLPTVQNDKESQFSLIEESIQNQIKSKEYESNKLERIQNQKNKVTKELKGDKNRINGYTKKLIDEQMKLIDIHYQKEQNPYL
jgi:hypothetical protein